MDDGTSSTRFSSAALAPTITQISAPTSFATTFPRFPFIHNDWSACRHSRKRISGLSVHPVNHKHVNTIINIDPILDPTVSCTSAHSSRRINPAGLSWRMSSTLKPPRVTVVSGAWRCRGPTRSVTGFSRPRKWESPAIGLGTIVWRSERRFRVISYGRVGGRDSSGAHDDSSEHRGRTGERRAPVTVS